MGVRVRDAVRGHSNTSHPLSGSRVRREKGPAKPLGPKHRSQAKGVKPHKRLGLDRQTLPGATNHLDSIKALPVKTPPRPYTGSPPYSTLMAAAIVLLGSSAGSKDPGPAPSPTCADAAPMELGRGGGAVRIENTNTQLH